MPAEKKQEQNKVTSQLTLKLSNKETDHSSNWNKTVEKDKWTHKQS